MSAGLGSNVGSPTVTPPQPDPVDSGSSGGGPTYVAPVDPSNPSSPVAPVNPVTPPGSSDPVTPGDPGSPGTLLPRPGTSTYEHAPFFREFLYPDYYCNNVNQKSLAAGVAVWGTQPVTFAWFYGPPGQAVPVDPARVVTVQDSKALGGQGADSLLTFLATPADDGMTLYCVASNTLGQVTSRVGTVHYYVDPSAGTPANAYPEITSAAAATVAVGNAFNYQITASTATTGFAASGLPTGLRIDTTGGLISGTPNQTGTFPIALTAYNGTSKGTATISLQITSAAPGLSPVITSAPATSGQIGQTFSYQITATNSPTAYTATGLPAGVTLNASTGLISGTPTVSGPFTVAVTATNASGSSSASVAITLASVLSDPAITTPLNDRRLTLSDPAATFTLGINGSGTLSLQWYKDGVAVPGAKGNIYTTPTPATLGVGSYVYMVKVTNALGSVVQSSATLIVTPTTTPVLSFIRPLPGGIYLNQPDNYNNVRVIAGLDTPWPEDVSMTVSTNGTGTFTNATGGTPTTLVIPAGSLTSNLATNPNGCLLYKASATDFGAGNAQINSARNGIVTFKATGLLTLNGFSIGVTATSLQAQVVITMLPGNGPIN